MKLLVFFLACVIAMTQQQKLVTRQILKSQRVPLWSAVIDAVLSDQIAYTNILESKVYIDASRFINAPNSFKNVMLHEARHLLNAQHNDGSLAMNYSVVVDLNGNIINDNYLLSF